jgi:hypothetical protein
MQNAKQKEKKEAECLAILSRIAELEQQIADNEPFGATSQVTIPKAHRFGVLRLILKFCLQMLKRETMLWKLMRLIARSLSWTARRDTRVGNL